MSEGPQPQAQPASRPGHLGTWDRGSGSVAGLRAQEVEDALPAWPPRPHDAPAAPALVPLLAMKLAMSTCLPSMDRFRMQPTNCRFRTGKSSGRLGTPPRSSGPVRSRDLWRQRQPLKWRAGEGDPGVAITWCC